MDKVDNKVPEMKCFNITESLCLLLDLNLILDTMSHVWSGNNMQRRQSVQIQNRAESFLCSRKINKDVLYKQKAAPLWGLHE